MRIIPVIDIMNGQAVHAIAGHRDYYRPVQSAVTESADPVRLLRALKRRFGAEECYVADINRLQRKETPRCVLAELAEVGLPMMVDVGISTVADVNAIESLQVDRVILGSETVASLNVVAELVRLFGADRFVFSVDMKNGQLVSSNAEWQGLSPFELAVQAAAVGIRQFILLDLSAVGTCRGVSSTGLCRQIRTRVPGCSILAGGGIRSVEHLEQLEQAGADGALVATAFHNGILTAADVQRFARRPTPSVTS
ncbi:MAG: hypothetical protein KDA85_08110 [Planctomycetaceae bacterium]|nr:hypothetical protein [Planctomycetaceae bacterium]